jgi:hypothetical protein
MTNAGRKIDNTADFTQRSYFHQFSVIGIKRKKVAVNGNKAIPCAVRLEIGGWIGHRMTLLPVA